MLMRRFLFETRFGEWLLVLLERYVGLAMVQADQLAVQRSGKPPCTSNQQEIADG